MKSYKDFHMRRFKKYKPQTIKDFFIKLFSDYKIAEISSGSIIIEGDITKLEYFSKFETKLEYLFSKLLIPGYFKDLDKKFELPFQKDFSKYWFYLDIRKSSLNGKKIKWTDNSMETWQIYDIDKIPIRIVHRKNKKYAKFMFMAEKIKIIKSTNPL